jgi:hypothetical protein
MIEIIKIGEIMGDMILLKSEDPKLEYYINILVNNCNLYKYQKTQGIIRSKSYSGIPDFEPTIGESFTLDNSEFWTSVVTLIVSENVIITRNSVYALHDKSKLRQKKLNELGI